MSFENNVENAANLEAIAGNTEKPANAPYAVTITKSSGTTAEDAKDCVNDATMTITGATNATPIVVTATAHPLQTGDAVTIASVGGNTAANGTFVVTKLTADTFSLQNATTLADVAGNGAYTSGGTAIRIPAFTLAEYNGQQGYITKGQIYSNKSDCTTTLKLHVFTLPPTGIADNAQMTLLDANKDKRIGPISFSALATEGSGSDESASIVSVGSGNLPMHFKCNADRKTLYALLETVDGFTPSSLQTFYIKLSPDLN